MLSKLRRHRPALQPFLERVSSLVQSDAFHAALIDLDLLERTGGEESSSNRKAGEDLFRMPDELDLCKNLVVPPPPEDSNGLASNLERTFDVMEVPDMTVAVYSSSEDQEAEIIPCHRVVLAARCAYFRRALLSGMREAIERRFDVRDTSSPALFRSFLRFIYCGRLDDDQLGADDLSELLLLADRYEMDAMKEVCEWRLAGCVDADTVLGLLSMADHFNLAILRVRSTSNNKMGMCSHRPAAV